MVEVPWPLQPCAAPCWQQAGLADDGPPLQVLAAPWLQPAELELGEIISPWQISNGYLCILQPPINRWLAIPFPLKEETITLSHRTRQIRARLRGDEVVAIENFGADLTFFDLF